jgi:soluble lytic murein transglycosylase-like protein
LADPEAAPILSHEHFCTILVHVARAYNLPIGFFTNLIWQESGFKHWAVSRAGAQGVAQFMPHVAEKLGLENPFDAREALPASARLLQTLHAQFGNLGLAAAAYNAGPKRVIEWRANRSQLKRETLEYVLAITGRPAKSWDRADPETVVFRVPPRVPCHDVELFAEAERKERAQAEVQAGEDPRATQRMVAARGEPLPPRRQAAALPLAKRVRTARLARKTRIAERPRIARIEARLPNIQIAVPEEAPKVPVAKTSRSVRVTQRPHTTRIAARLPNIQIAVEEKPRKQRVVPSAASKKNAQGTPRLSGPISASSARKPAVRRTSGA